MPTTDPTLLRRALRANAAFSLLTGGAMILAAGPLASFLGLGPAWVLPPVGAGLLLFAAALLQVASRPRVPLALAAAATAGDLLWVLGSAALLLLRPETFGTAGQWTVGVIAVLVLDFAVAQGLGLRRAQAPVPDPR